MGPVELVLGNKRKALKERTKGYESARNTENGAKTANIWEKQSCRDLVAINYRHEGLVRNFCKTHKIVLTKRARARVRSEKEQTRDVRFYFIKEQGLKRNKKDCFINISK